MPSPQLNGFNLHYERAGQGPAVVYIHGGFASLASRLTQPEDYAWEWEHTFSAQFDFIEYERRGCFRSGCPERGYDLSNQAADLEALLDHLKIQAAHLIGSSAGGPIALLFAATRPERVRSLTLAGTGLNLFNQPDDPITQVICAQLDLLDREGAEAAFAARPTGVEASFGVLWEPAEMKERGTLERYLARQGEINARAAGLAHSVRLRHFAAELRNMGAYIHFDLRPYAAWVKAPTLVLHGTNDREVPVAQGEELGRAIAGARLVKMEGESHTLVIRSTKAQEIVRQFIKEAEQHP